ncbi:MAG TPA: 2-nitropropane dioxygenase [Planctomycetes bacterium]|nr:2-nitropropane dioxygenase [Planctomycetota bacterium]
MAKQHLEILCPDCKSRLEVDPATGEVSSYGKEKKVEDLADAAAKVEKRKTKHEDAFASGLEAEKRRSEELDDLFKQAAEQVEDDDEKPDNPMEDKWR